MNRLPPCMPTFYKGRGQDMKVGPHILVTMPDVTGISLGPSNECLVQQLPCHQLIFMSWKFNGMPQQWWQPRRTWNEKVEKRAKITDFIIFNNNARHKPYPPPSPPLSLSVFHFPFFFHFHITFRPNKYIFSIIGTERLSYRSVCYSSKKNKIVTTDCIGCFRVYWSQVSILRYRCFKYARQKRFFRKLSRDFIFFLKRMFCKILQHVSPTRLHSSRCKSSYDCSRPIFPSTLELKLTPRDVTIPPLLTVLFTNWTYRLDRAGGSSSHGLSRYRCPPPGHFRDAANP